MDCIVHGVAKSQTRLSDFHFWDNSAIFSHSFRLVQLIFFSHITLFFDMFLFLVFKFLIQGEFLKYTFLNALGYILFGV